MGQHHGVLEAMKSVGRVRCRRRVRAHVGRTSTTDARRELADMHGKEAALVFQSQHKPPHDAEHGYGLFQLSDEELGGAPVL